MSDEIIKLLNDLSSRFEVAIDWSSKNMTPYLQELFQKYTRYEIALNIFYVVLCVVMAIVFAILTQRYIDKGTGFLHDLLFTAGIISMFVGVFFAVNLITVCTFPEKFIITELKILLSR